MSNTTNWQAEAEQAAADLAAEQAEAERLRAELAQAREDLHASHQAGVSAAAQRDALAARLAEIERAEPVAWIEHELQGTGLRHLHFERRPNQLRDEVVAPVWTALIARPAPAAAQERESGRRVTVDAGALQMVISALRRDAEEGRPVRGEMADALTATMAAATGGER